MLLPAMSSMPGCAEEQGTHAPSPPFSAGPYRAQTSNGSLGSGRAAHLLPKAPLNFFPQAGPKEARVHLQLLLQVFDVEHAAAPHPPRRRRPNPAAAASVFVLPEGASDRAATQGPARPGVSACRACEQSASFAQIHLAVKRSATCTLCLREENVRRPSSSNSLCLSKSLPAIE